MLSRAWNKQVVQEQLLEFNMHFHEIINSTTFLELNSGVFGNRLLWTLSHPASGEGNVTLLHRTFKPKGRQGTQLQIGF